MRDPHGHPGDPFAGFRLDHAQVLDHLAALEARTLGGEELRDEGPVRELVAHLERQFATHMRAEDQVLYPALRAAFPEARATLEPLLADHAELRHLLAALGAALGRPRDAARNEQLAVIARDLVDLLRLHIRREEAVVLDVAARVLTREELAAMASALEAWRNNPPGARAERKIP